MGIATTSTLQPAGPRLLSDGNPNGTVLGNSLTDQIGFYGDTTPVGQATPAGFTATPSAGSTTNAFVNTTFSGGVGTTAYTVGDLIAILKATNLFKL